MRLNCLALAFLLAAAPLAGAQAARDKPLDERTVVNSAGFMNAHPDLRHRIYGSRAYRKARYDEAAAHFRRAARYADKPSQAMIGEMYWDGRGLPLDRVKGYIWMDLAAERGYPLMIAKREVYWRQLSEAERSRVEQEGLPVYAEYGDEAAKPRLARVMKRELRQMTGSRTGATGFLKVEIPTATGWLTVSGDDYYHDKYWQPERYFEWQDTDWSRPATGTVEVGEILIEEEPADD